MTDYIDLDYQLVPVTIGNGMAYVQYNSNTVANIAENTLDIYRPLETITNLRPVIILAHPGGLSLGNKQDPDMVEIATLFARSGWKVLSIGYRPTGELQATCQDFRAAVRWVKHNAVAYGFNTNIIVAGGSSAGATLAMYTICRDDFEIANGIGGSDAFIGNSRPNGFMGWSGTYIDIATYNYGYDTRPTSTEVALAISQGRLDVAYLAHGHSDGISYRNSEILACACRKGSGGDASVRFNKYQGGHIDYEAWRDQGFALEARRFMKAAYSL